MDMLILSECRPGKLFGCDSPVSKEALEDVIGAIPFHREKGIVNLIIRGQVHKPFPPKSEVMIASVLSHPRNDELGMFHWKKQGVVFLRRLVLEEVISKGFFVPGNDYPALVKAVRMTGRKVVDVSILFD